MSDIRKQLWADVYRDLGGISSDPGRDARTAVGEFDKQFPPAEGPPVRLVEVCIGDLEMVLRAGLSGTAQPGSNVDQALIRLRSIIGAAA